MSNRAGGSEWLSLSAVRPRADLLLLAEGISGMRADQPKRLKELEEGDTISRGSSQTYH